MKKDLYIFGCSGIAKSMIDSLLRSEVSNIKDIFVVDQNKELTGKAFYANTKVIHTEDFKKRETKGCYGVIAYYKPADIFSRSDDFELYIKDSQLIPLTIIDPNAVVSPTATVGNGSYIGANTYIDSNAVVGDNTIILFNSVISREVVIEHNVFISASVVIKGGVTLSHSIFVSAGCIVTTPLTSYVFLNAGVVMNYSVESFSIVGLRPTTTSIQLPNDIAKAKKRLTFFHP